MMFDISLPVALSLITLAVLFVHTKLSGKVRSLVGGREFKTRDVILLVVMMGVMVTVLGWTVITIPQRAIMVFFLFAYFTGLFMFTYLIVPRWYLAVFAPAVFLILYFFWWNFYSFNLFAVVFSLYASVYLGCLFSWKTTAIFLALLTLMDVIQVFVTGFMIEASKIVGEQLLLPVAIILPTFPSKVPPSGFLGLGLGDIFLTGLLAIQTKEKYGNKWGIATAIVMGAVFLLLETAWINSGISAFPATVFVIPGWLTALGIRYLYKSSIGNE